MHFQWFSSLKSAFTPGLTDLSTAQEEKVRKGAMKAMGMTGDSRCCNALIAGLSNKNGDVREAALTALGELGDETTTAPMVASLSDENSDVREAAANALEKIRSRQTLPALAQTLKNDESSSVKRSAARAIAAIGGNEAFEILRDAVRSRSKETRIFAIQHLPDLTHPSVTTVLIDQLKSKFSEVRLHVVESLACLKNAEIIPHLARKINDNSPSVARASIRSLAQIGNAQAISALLSALSSKQPGIRILAYDMLRSSSASIVMEQFLWNRQEPVYSKLLKARLLALVGTKPAFQFLQILVTDSDESVRAQFIQCLSAFDKNLIYPFLREFCRDKSALVRKTTMNIILRLNIVSLNSEVKRLRRDSDKVVSWLAQRFTEDKALTKPKESKSKVNWPSFRLLPEIEEEHQTQAEITRKTLSYPAVKRLPAGPISALTDQDPEVRHCALQMKSLWEYFPGEYDDTKIHNLVCSLLSDPSPKVQAYAVLALATREVVWRELITNKKKHPLVRLAAIQQADMRESAVVEQLLKAMKDKHWLIRSAALEKVSSIRKTNVYKDIVKTLRSQKGDMLVLALIDIEHLYKRLEGKGFMPRFSKEDETHLCEDILEDFIHKLRQKCLRENLGSDILSIQKGARS